MQSVRSKSPRVVLANLADSAITAGILFNGKGGPVGRFLNRLSKTDRELIKELKSDDIADDTLIRLKQCPYDNYPVFWPPRRYSEGK